ncbi:MAG: hypothetical protein GXY18_12590 [Methanomicrobiales archaeon]|nr:hypothetical protein [Methanomicrobiales archaeon]
MIQLILDKEDEIKRICIKYKVKTLSLTGSGFSGTWDPHNSDIDFIIEFQSFSPEEHADCYFGMVEELESILGYPVYIIEMNAISNPYLRESFLSSQEPLYPIT